MALQYFKINTQKEIRDVLELSVSGDFLLYAV